MKPRFWIIVLGCLAALGTTLATAQTGTVSQFELTGFTINSGGLSIGVSVDEASGGKERKYAIVDTVGQLQAETQNSATQNNGIYALNSGFLTGPATVDSLVLLYLNGDNDLWEHILEAAQQAQAGANITKTVTVVLMLLDGPQADDAYLYRLDHKGATRCNFYEDYTCSGRYLLGYNVEKYADNLGAPSTLTQFLTDSINAYPSSQQIILSIVGHGGGWAPNLRAGQPQGHVGQPGDGGLVWDNNGGGEKAGTSLSTIELGDALRAAKEQTGRKIDLLYLDACLMGMWEVSYQIRESVNYLVASESWTWTAFAYDKLLQDLGESLATIELGKSWTQHKRATIATLGYPHTYALIDLSQMETMSQSVNSLASALIDLLSIESSKIYTAFLASDCFDSDTDLELDRGNINEEGDTYCDLLSFTHQLTTTMNAYPELVNAAEAAASTVRSTVLEPRQGNGYLPGQYGSFYWSWKHLGGISIYLPLNEKDDWKRKYYKDLASSKGEHGWDEFVDTYRKNSENSADPTCPDPCPLPQGPLVVSDYPIFLPLIQR